MEIRILKYGSEDYLKMVSLRTEILRKPLGLIFTPEQLEKEASDLLIGVFDGSNIIGCCLLTPKKDHVVQLRQMAVDQKVQRMGVGAALLKFAEQTCLEHGFITLMLHARKEAIGFYTRSGYCLSGPEFLEVGILHQQMQKQLLRS